MRSAISSRIAASVVALCAAAAVLAPAPARAFFCFGFSMDGGPSFRFGMGEPTGLRIMQLGPPGALPQSYVVPWNAPLHSAWNTQPGYAPYANSFYGGMPYAGFPSVGMPYGGGAPWSGMPVSSYPYGGLPFTPSPWGGGFPGMSQPWPMMPMGGMPGW